MIKYESGGHFHSHAMYTLLTVFYSIEEWASSDARIRAYNTNSTSTAGMATEIAPSMTMRTPAARTSGDIDLLKEYDRGIQRIHDWDKDISK
jgi:hypothetical protein